jgi:hypothetical protein
MTGDVQDLIAVRDAVLSAIFPEPKKKESLTEPT